MDVLLNRLRQSILSCEVTKQYFGCLLHVDDIILLSHSANAMLSMLLICEQFVTDFVVKFNSLKSTVMGIGERFDVKCASLMLVGCELRCVQCFNVLHLVLAVFFQFHLEEKWSMDVQDRKLNSNND